MLRKNKQLSICQGTQFLKPSMKFLLLRRCGRPVMWSHINIWREWLKLSNMDGWIVEKVQSYKTSQNWFTRKGYDLHVHQHNRAWLRATNKVHAFKRRTICTTSEIEIGCKTIHYHNIWRDTEREIRTWLKHMLLWTYQEQQASDWQMHMNGQ